MPRTCEQQTTATTKKLLQQQTDLSRVLQQLKYGLRGGGVVGQLPVCLLINEHGALGRSLASYRLNFSGEVHQQRADLADISKQLKASHRLLG